ncbi:MAG: acetylglutamate kinase, partial [Bacteroidota bacterium]|nr:acetylglutamate kinase [Bacteroidota bacterium]
FELMGVLKELDDSESVIELIDFKLYKKLVKKNILSKGMIPKLENAFKALKSGVENIFIGLPQIINKKNKVKYTKIIS